MILHCTVSFVCKGHSCYLSLVFVLHLETALQDLKKDPTQKREYREAKKLLSEVRDFQTFKFGHCRVTQGTEASFGNCKILSCTYF